MGRTFFPPLSLMLFLHMSSACCYQMFCYRMVSVSSQLERSAFDLLFENLSSGPTNNSNFNPCRTPPTTDRTDRRLLLCKRRLLGWAVLFFKGCRRSPLLARYFPCDYHEWSQLPGAFSVSQHHTEPRQIHLHLQHENGKRHTCYHSKVWW